jgi:hypothetical protein
MVNTKFKLIGVVQVVKFPDFLDQNVYRCVRKCPLLELVLHYLRIW